MLLQARTLGASGRDLAAHYTFGRIRGRELSLTKAGS